MPRRFISALFFATQFLFYPHPSPAQSSISSSSCPCTLLGSVVDVVSGQPVPHALVKLSSPLPRAALTDSEGKFQFEGLPAGRVTLAAEKPGFLYGDSFGSSTTPTFAFELGPGTPPATLKLTPEGVIFGQITDENGEPLENFLVSLIYRNPLHLPLSAASRLQVTTDDEGKFRISGLLPGFYTVAVHPMETSALTSAKNAAVPRGFAPFFYPAASDLDSAIPIKVLPGKPSQANFSLKREPFLRLSGTVSGYTAEQEVVLSLQDSSGEQVRQDIEFDASTGAFHTMWIPPGNYTLSSLAHIKGSPDSSALSFARQSIHANSNLSAIHLGLQPTVKIPYVIHGLPSTDPDGQQSRRFSFWLSPKGLDSRCRPIYSTWFNGHSGPSSESPILVLDGVEPGTYEVEAGVDPERIYYVESLSWGSTNLLHDPLVLDSAGAVPPIEVFLREGAAILSGTVFSNDQPVPAVVVLFLPDEKIKPDFVSADSDGTFMRIGLAPGTYHVIAIENSAGLDLEHHDALRILSSKAHEITLAPGQTTSVRLELTKGEE